MRLGGIGTCGLEDEARSTDHLFLRGPAMSDAFCENDSFVVLFIYLCIFFKDQMKGDKHAKI